MPPKPPSYFPSIDILRGFAALSVVAYHVIVHFAWKDFPIEGPLVWFRIGWMGVDLFFVISGFVIGLSAFAEIDKHGTSAFRKPFFQRRLSRIVPLHYFTVLIFVAMVVPQVLFENFWLNAVTHLLFLHNLFPAFHGAINGSNWSLGTEMQFYVLMLVLAPWLLRTAGWKVFCALLLTAWAWRYGCTLILPVAGDQDTNRLFMASTQLPGTLDEFVAGLLLAKLLRSQRAVGTLLRWPLVPIALAIVATWGVLTLFWRFTYWDIPFMVVFYKSLLAGAFFFVVMAACALSSPRWVMLTAPLRYLGTISYGIYLWHLPVLLTLRDLPWLTPQRALPLVVLLTLCLAAASWHFFEQPFIKRFQRPVNPDLRT